MILVTGGAGYIGSVLLNKLVEENYQVRVLDLLIYGDEGIRKHKNIELVTEDIRDSKKQIFSGIKHVIHLAGFSNDPTANFAPQINSDINTIATIRLAKFAKNSGVKRFIFASSCSIYDQGVNGGQTLQDENSIVNPQAHYSLSKYNAERELLKLATNQFEVIIVRKGTVYGWSDRMRFDLVINTMLKDAFTKGEINVYCGGRQWRPLISVNDVAQVYLSLLKTNDKNINKQVINVLAFNKTIKELALTIQKMIKPIKRIKINIFDEAKEIRSYKVSNQKYSNLFPEHKYEKFEYTLNKIINKIKNYSAKKLNDPKYYNIEWIKKHYLTLVSHQDDFDQ